MVAKLGRRMCVPFCQLVSIPMVGASPSTTILISKESEGRAVVLPHPPPRVMPGIQVTESKIKVLQTVGYAEQVFFFFFPKILSLA